jgi:hypothetical protein
VNVDEALEAATHPYRTDIEAVLAAEVQRLQERDEAGAAVVRAWEAVTRSPESIAASAELAGELDELVRVYEDKGGDR